MYGLLNATGDHHFPDTPEDNTSRVIPKIKTLCGGT